jgi:hypothetical protein
MKTIEPPMSAVFLTGTLSFSEVFSMASLSKTQVPSRVSVWRIDIGRNGHEFTTVDRWMLQTPTLSTSKNRMLCSKEIHV